MPNTVRWIDLFAWGALVGLPMCASGSTAAVADIRAPAPETDPAVVGTSSAARYRVHNAWIAVEVDSDDERRAFGRQAQVLASDLGGYVSEEGTEGFVLRVPVDRLDAALAGIATLGEIIEQRISVEEVTEQYVDLSVRRDNLRRLKARLQALLERAESVQDVLPIEKELARVTEELERLEGRLRVLSDRVRLATVRVEYRDRVRPGPIGWVFYGLFAAIKWLFVWD